VITTGTFQFILLTTTVKGYLIDKDCPMGATLKEGWEPLLYNTSYRRFSRLCAWLINQAFYSFASVLVFIRCCLR